MTAGVRLALGVLAVVVVGFLLWALSDVLMPFVLGLAIAYLLDPLADRLERAGMGRGIAAFTLLLTFFLVFVAALLVLVPMAQNQIAGFAERVPGYLEALRNWAGPWIADALQRFGDSGGQQNLQEAASAYAGNVVRWIGRVAAGLWGGGLAFVHVLSLILIMPLVAFYLLRDWDRLVATIAAHLPVRLQGPVSRQAAEVDRTLAGFVRGQSMVCLLLGVMYALGLSLLGLEFGLLIGIGAGLLSFIPYFGTGTGLVVSVAVGLAQFGLAWPLAGVIAVFAVGQLIEGFWLTPNLVGDRVRLHPVWVIFALMAGGSLFGFTGVMLAVPVAAVIGVLVRAALASYRDRVDTTGGL